MLLGFVMRHLRSEQVTRAVYGSIIALAVVVVLEIHPPAPRQAIAGVLGAALAVALAEIYSDLIGSSIRMRRRLTPAERREIARNASGGFVGAAAPVVFFVLAGLHLVHMDTALVLARWTGLGLIGLYAFVAARFAGFSVLGAAALGAFGLLIGGILVGLHAVTH